MKIRLVSCRDVKALVKYIKDNDISKNNNILNSYGNMYYTDLEKDIDSIIKDAEENNKNYFIHTHNFEVYKMFCDKLFEQSKLEYIKFLEDEIKVYSNEEFIDLMIEHNVTCTEFR